MNSTTHESGRTSTTLATLAADAAQLPALYQAAQRALVECSELDEVKDWSDRAAAMAMYARQAKDSTLMLLAQRIQARAVRRCGELLKQVPRGDEATRFGRDCGVPPVTRAPVTRAAVADEAGLTERQRKTALRVASVPASEFERQVESERPPTVGELARQGTTTAAPRQSDSELEEVRAALARFASFCETHSPHEVAQRFNPAGAASLRGSIKAIDAWMDSFVTNLPLDE